MFLYPTITNYSTSYTGNIRDQIIGDDDMGSLPVWNFGISTQTYRQKAVNRGAPGGGLFNVTINLPSTEADTNYGVLVVPHANMTVWVTNKLVGSFVLNYSVAGGCEVDWFLFR